MTERRPRRRLPVAPRSLLCLLAVLLPAAASLAEESPERPKIGLALSGGGAKGIAHVGVLQALDELGVPIDYVAGTSMGAIIGGLYASGISPDELATIVAETDWAEILADEPSRRDLSFRRKQDSQRYLLDVELGLGREGLEFPPGLQTGQKLTLMLQWLTRQVADVRDFDRLPTPFRCVATDIATGDAVVLEDGDLAWAMRASMAIPSIFTPVELDGRTLVDGGIAANLPIEVVRSMGADLVIAVDLGAPLESRDVEGWVGIYQQLMRMLTRKNVEQQLPRADIVLSPPGVSEFGTLDFSSVEEIRRLGLRAVEENEEELRQLSVDRPTYERLMARRDRPAEPATVVGEIHLAGNERVDPRIIRNLMTLAPGEPMEWSLLAEDLGTIYGLGDFERVGFRLEPGEEGRSDLVVDMEEKSWGPNYLHFGLFFDSDLDAEFNASVLVNLTLTRLDARGAEWRNDLRLGRRQGVYSEFYQPLDFRGRWFVAPTLLFERSRPDLFLDGEVVAELEETVWSTGVGLGYQFSRYAELRGVLEYGKRRLVQEAGSLSIQTVDAPVAGVRLLGRVDRLDDAIFPARGGIGSLDLFASREALGSELDYTKGELRFSQFYPVGRNRLLWSLAAGGRIGSRAVPIWDLFTLGGFGSLSGFEDDELRGQYKGVLRAGLYRATRSSLRFGGFLEGGNVWQESSDIDVDTLVYTATLFVGLDLRLGPVILAWGITDDGRDQIYLTVGRTF